MDTRCVDGLSTDKPLTNNCLFILYTPYFRLHPQRLGHRPFPFPFPFEPCPELVVYFYIILFIFLSFVSALSLFFGGGDGEMETE